MLRSSVWSLLGVSTFVYWAVACGNSDHASPIIGGGVAGSASNGAGTGPDLGNVGNGGKSSSGSSPGDGETCAADLVEAQRVPLDIYVMLDVSGSMLEATEGDASTTKWQAVSSALTDFVSDDASSGIGVGLQVFPILQKDAPPRCTSDAQCGTFGPCINRACWPPVAGVVSSCFDAEDCDYADQECVVLGECAANENYVCNADATSVCGEGHGACVVPESICMSLTDCRSATYATPAAPIAELPGARAALVGVIQSSMPDEGGLTPSGPALQGALEQAKSWAKAHPERQVVAVLATDGLPTLQSGSATTCAPVRYLEDIDAVVALATDGRTMAPAVSTFVIGVVGPDDTSAPAILNRIARAGGSTEAFIVDTSGNVQEEFRAALNAIRASGLSCDLAVPIEDEGKSVDYDKVNVEFTNEVGTKQELYRVDGAADCADAPSGQGWYYDTNPKASAPTRISVCPTVCTEFQKTNRGSVNIALGCEQRVVVK